MIVDAHMHAIERLATFCGKGEGRPIGGGKVRMATGDVVQMIPSGMGEYGFPGESCVALMDRHTVDVSVLLQGGFYGFQNEYAFEVSKKYPGRFHPVAGIDPYCVEKGAILDNLVNRWGFRALKLEASQSAGIASYHPGFRVDGPELMDVYEVAQRNNMTIVVDVGGPGQESYQIKGLRRVFDTYGGIRFVVCHLLAPKMGNQPNWEEEIRLLATENAWLDFSALPYNIREAYPYPSSIEHVEKASRIAGSDRLIWGSDCPFVLNNDPYENLMSYVRHSKVLKESALENMMGRNAIVAYDIHVQENGRNAPTTLSAEHGDH